MTEQHAALTAAVADSDDPIVRYKARRYLDGADPASASMRRLRDDIADSPIARGLLADLAISNPNDREGMSTIYLTLRYLAEIDYPPGDDQLVPYRDHVYRWLRGLEREYDGPLFIRGTHRVHGSFHANAIYASVVLGLADDETDELCANLLRYQWPGGGWNCNKKPATKGPTIVHTAFGLRGLATYRSRRTSDELTAGHRRRRRGAARPQGLPEAIRREAAAARLHQAVVSLPSALRLHGRAPHPHPRRVCHRPAMRERTRPAGVQVPPRRRLGDGAKALQPLQGTDGFTHAPWEEVKLGRANLLLTIDALEILRTAGRW